MSDTAARLADRWAIGLVGSQGERSLRLAQGESASWSLDRLRHCEKLHEGWHPIFARAEIIRSFSGDRSDESGSFGIQCQGYG